jgi:type II secretory pathway pseudopilin PulG
MGLSGRPVCPRSAGFTLLEVMIAFIIAGLGIAALTQAGAVGLGATQAATRYEEALARARSRLDAATHGAALVAGDNRGSDGGGFSWRVRVSPVATATLSQFGNIPRPSVPMTLYAVTVWIGGRQGDLTRDVRLDTRQIGRNER